MAAGATMRGSTGRVADAEGTDWPNGPLPTARVRGQRHAAGGALRSGQNDDVLDREEEAAVSVADVLDADVDCAETDEASFAASDATCVSLATSVSFTDDELEENAVAISLSVPAAPVICARNTSDVVTMALAAVRLPARTSRRGVCVRIS